MNLRWDHVKKILVLLAYLPRGFFVIKSNKEKECWQLIRTAKKSNTPTNRLARCHINSKPSMIIAVLPQRKGEPIPFSRFI
jgi:hypothetical protein